MESDAQVDILLATYNGEDNVAEQIESICNQSFSKWLLHVSDDCSADRTLEIVQSYASYDCRIMIESRGIRYGGSHRNFCSLCKRSRLPYIMFCDQDDVWFANKIEIMLNEIKKLEGEYGASTPILVFSDMEVVDRHLSLISQSFARFTRLDPTRLSFSSLLAQNVAPGCSMIINRALLLLFLESMNVPGVAMHDWWAMLLASAFGKIGYISKPLVKYRQHGTNVVGAQKFRVLERAVHPRRMLERFDESVVQALSFYREYSSRLGIEERSAAFHYSTLNSKRGMSGLYHLIASGSWKKGIRGLGQAVCALGLFGNVR